MVGGDKQGLEGCWGTCLRILSLRVKWGLGSFELRSDPSDLLSSLPCYLQSLVKGFSVMVLLLF